MPQNLKTGLLGFSCVVLFPVDIFVVFERLQVRHHFGGHSGFGGQTLFQHRREKGEGSYDDGEEMSAGTIYCLQAK